MSGTWAVRAFATDEASNTTNPDAVYTKFRVLLKTRLPGFAAKADPETGALTASARLVRYRAGKGWEPFKARAIALEFRPKGESGFKAVATATTDDRGDVNWDKVTASGPGAWRATFAGHPNYGRSTSAADYVSYPK